jgi:hypothetical protein
VCARYIGEVGQHYTPDEFRRLRFHEAIMGEDDGADWVFDRPDAAQLDAIVAAQRADMMSQRLGAQTFLSDPGFVASLRVASSIGAVPRPGLAGALAAVAGLHVDAWCGPRTQFVIPAALGVRSMALHGVAGPHLPGETALNLTLNGVAAVQRRLSPGAPFTLAVQVPAQLAGLEVVVATLCAVAADGFSARINHDRRALAYRLERLDLILRDGDERRVSGAELAGAVYGLGWGAG